MIKVADVSRWQGIINFDLLKNDIQAIVIKATGGDAGLYIDPQFYRNRNEARRAGLPRWFYHFAGSNDAVKEADHFVNAVGALYEGEGLVLDWELGSGQLIPIGWCQSFANRVIERTGVKPLIYSNDSRIKNSACQPLVAMDLGVWIASYGTNNGQPQKQPSPNPWPFIAMWQYTSVGRLSGIAGNVDLNLFMGDAVLFQKYGKRFTTTPTPMPLPPVIEKPQPQPPTPAPNTYTVKSSDWDGLAAAMKRIGINNWQEIASINGLKPPYVIRVGQVLRLTGNTPQPQPTPAITYYDIKSGDTLGAIAVKFGTTINQLMIWNPIISNANRIQAGWKIRVK